ncbi:MAG: hypothetical protein KC561_15770, partial [Myxococcales bacterium]|nr:hypothetical protein [Myxococcales bacterium]
SFDLDTMTLRLEGVLPWHLDDGELRAPRLVLGWDYFATDLFLSFEYTYNGAGTTDESEYLGVYSGEAFSRGEIYLVGQHYLGGLLTYQLWELLGLNLSVITNLTDPSVIVSPTFNYNVAENMTIIGGAYTVFGASPEIGFPTTLNSEFGTYGDLYFVLMQAFF